MEYGYKARSTSGTVFNFFNALGQVAFAYAGHNVVLEIQATLPTSPEKPSKLAMWRGVVIAYIVVALCYFPVAFIGYYTFGNTVEDNILISLEKPGWLIVTANMFVIIHIIGGYQVNFVESCPISVKGKSLLCVYTVLGYSSYCQLILWWNLISSWYRARLPHV